LEFKVRVYLAEDVPAVIELGRACHPSEYDPERLSGRLNWLFQNPFGCHAWVAEMSGRVVGFMAWLMVQIAVMNRTVLASMGIDLMVLPEYRRKGIAAELITTGRTSLISKGARLGFGFTNQVSLELDKKLGGTLIAPLARYYLPVTFRALILHTFLKFGSSLSDVRRRSERLSSQSSTDLSLESCEPTKSNLELLSTAMNCLGNVRVTRDSNYLHWLFSRQQKLPPRLLLAKKEGKIVGYAAYSVGHRTPLFRVGELLDIAAEKSSTAQRILNALCLQSSSVDFWSVSTLQGGALAEILGTMGFSSWSHDGGLICKIWEDDADSATVMDASNWHLTQFDIL